MFEVHINKSCVIGYKKVSFYNFGQFNKQRFYLYSKTRGIIDINSKYPIWSNNDVSNLSKQYFHLQSPLPLIYNIQQKYSLNHRFHSHHQNSFSPDFHHSHTIVFSEICSISTYASDRTYLQFQRYQDQNELRVSAANSQTVTTAGPEAGMASMFSTLY